MRAYAAFILMTLLSVPTLTLAEDNTPTWQVTDEGLRIRDDKLGDGVDARTGAKVTVHYTGRLQDGTVFDSSELRGTPFSFRLGASEVIRGWDQGLIGMRVGGERTLVIPPELGYGSVEAGKIPPDSTLEFTVRLLAADVDRIAPSRPLLNTSGPASDGRYLKDLTPGEGPQIQIGQMVTVEATLWSPDGRMMFTTYDAPSSLEFTAGGGQVQPFLDKEIRLMRKGQTRVLQFVEQPDGPPPYTVLLEVLDVQAERKPPQAPPEVTIDQWRSLPSGTLYADLSPGEGSEASEGKSITVEYTGWVHEGAMFDSSLLREVPFSFTLGAGEVIEGWEEGLIGLRPGSKRLLMIPPSAAYGASGAGASIPPYSTLVFLVEVLDVET